MAHQGEIENVKYRNWVRGVLAYKYLRCGIEGFADAIAQKEHERILHVVKQNPSFKVCNKCDLRTLRPIHECDPNIKKRECPLQLASCNCLKEKKYTKKCRHNACDAILEEIIKSHASSPPAPNLKNTDIEKWCSAPWEVAKCFIAAPGYRKKTDASDIDIAGLLHVFINSIEFQNKITNVNIFKEVLYKRNMIFHSTTMELDDKEMSDCIDDIITILEDDKELKARNEAQQSVAKLRQLKQHDFIITTTTAAEAHKDSLYLFCQKIEANKQVICDDMSDLESKVHEANSHFGSEVHKANSDFDFKVHKANSDFDSKIHDANSDFDSKRQDFKMDIVSKIFEAKSDIDGKIRDAKSDIDCKIKDAKSTVRSIFKAFVDSEHKPSNCHTQEMKQMIEVQNDLIKQLKLGKQRFTDREPDVKLEDANLRRSCDVYQKEREYQEQKQVMQRMLVELYQKHYVKTWVSPLKVKENNINVNEVYVWPNMVIKPDTELDTPKDVSADNTISHDSKSTKIKRYHQVFQTNDVRHRVIYIVGDVGTGKSSFCKMMIYNWCRSLTDGDCNGVACLQTSDKTDKTTHRCPLIPHDEAAIRADNIKDMKQFEFLFFIPLQAMSGLPLNGGQVNDLFEMIKIQYINIASKFGECLKRIFEEESERCLVIADGLDEWTPPKHTPGHGSCGKPVADRIQNATLVTLSRHSAKGMLNIRLSEYDQKIEILGIEKDALLDFVKNYVSKLNRSDEYAYSFMNRVRLARLEHLEKTPLLLQQHIYTYCNNNSIGKSVSDIYSQMVNIMFCWFRDKKEEHITAARDYVHGEHKFELMQLPKLLGKYPNCKVNKIYLIILGKASFDALTAEIPTTKFGRLELQEYGLSNDVISKLIKIGILAEYNSIDPQYEATYLSFIHISYLEFFTAVYISCVYGAGKTHTPVEHDSEQSKSVLEELFIKFTSVADVLQLSQMLKMLCGLCPNMTVEISQLISNNMATDKSLINYRKDIHVRMLSSWPVLNRHKLVSQIQTLIVDCLSECGLDDIPVISLCDILIDSNFNMSIISKLKTSDVVSVKYIKHQSLAKISQWIEQLPNLQYIYMHTGRNRISCQKSDLVRRSLQRAVSLKNLTLSCQFADSKCHFLDLSNHDQLQSIRLDIDLVKTDFLLNLKHLETIYIYDDRYININSHNMVPVHVFCKYTFCEGHSSDSSEEEQIQNVYEDIDFDILLPIRINKSDEKATIPNKGELNHDFCGRLASAVEQATSLKHLSLRHGKCNREHCTYQSIDLSGHDQLQSLGLSSNFSVSLLNTSSLKDLFIGGLTDANRLLLHCRYSNLTYLSIHQLSSYTVPMNSAINTLGQLQRLSLRFVDIDENALTVSPEMNNLCEIDLDEVEIRFQTWLAFVESLLTPTQHIRVHASRFDVTKSEEEAFREYIEHNKMFKVVFSSSRTFRFLSNK
ncbi:uncharacterized protein LOC128551828 [Mercenaria mercenaria]|uniref:uncharacterized protein LOC128551828 n=1 Tax=Mercenaria mercenaria TaxID=6596 RepID=UPI00234EC63A|nr:uncharacterized protein LOC128551828 [Mercenaria mercenaria]XP_053388726.1 uncharacterized protein LOC128551828 [Mercenaria mercenaria]